MTNSPWARSWISKHKDGRKKLNLTPFDTILLVFILAGIIFVVGLQIGLSEGRVEGRKQGIAATEAKYDRHNNSWALEPVRGLK